MSYLFPYRHTTLLLPFLKRIMFWILVWTVLLLLVIATPALVQIVYPSEISVWNNSDIHLRDVEIFGEVGNKKWPSLAPGQAMAGEFNLAGTSVMGLKFLAPDGQIIEHWFAAADVFPQVIKLTIDPKLKVLKERPNGGNHG